MAYPTKAASAYDYDSYQDVNPADPLPAPELAADLAHLKAASDETIDFLKVSLRSDNRVAPRMVPASALTPDAILALGEWNSRGAWATATAYAVGDLVSFGSALFVAGEAHTSAALFGTDFVAGKWANINGADQNDVTLQMFGAIGDGSTDDSAACTAALAANRPIKICGGTFPLKNITINDTACALIYGDGSGSIVPASGATSSTSLFTVAKLTAFAFRNLRVVMPISTDGGVAPAASAAFRFSSSADDATVGDGWEVTDCRVTGGAHAIITNGRTKNGTFSRNTIDNTWREAIQVGFPDNCDINDNKMRDGGYATGGSNPAGAIRIGGTGSAYPSGNVSICRNHIINYCVNQGQSSIDCFTTELSNVIVDGNILDQNGSGIELKTQPSGITGEKYGSITVSNNRGRMRAADGSCVSILHTGVGGDDPISKGVDVVIRSNDFSCVSHPNPASATLYGIILSGYESVSIKGNNFLGTSRAVDISADGVVGDVSRFIDISGNTFDVIGAAIQTSGGTTTGLRIHDNPLIRSRTSAAISLNVGAIVSLTVERNTIHGVATYGIDCRNVTGGLIRDNSIRGGVHAIYFLGTTPAGIVVEDNRLATTWNAIPAVSGVVDTAGAGLTDGTRIFTVTSGTGTVPTIFSCVVSGGTITGAVVIIQPGSYSTFPTSPTVTVDSGIVGGAAFTLTGAAASNAVRVDTGSGLVVHRNSVDVATTARGVSGAGIAGCAAANNVRNLVTSDPTATYAAAVGDVFPNSAAGIGGVKEWCCVTAGNAGSAVFNAVMLRSLTSGTVTQLTNKSTGVTLNAARGKITLEATDAIGVGAAKLFVLTNSHIGANDFVAVTHDAGGTGGAYSVHAGVVAAGFCEIRITNLTAGGLAEAPILQFTVIKAP